VRLAIDCNVVISAALAPGTCRRLIEKAVGDHTIILCDDIVSEYRSVAMRPKFDSCRATLEEIISVLEAVGLPVNLSSTRFALPDPADEIYVAAAVAGDAEALIAGNTRHFAGLREVEVQVLTPRQFLDRFH
jgi:putative PIN family toxin of toxin-antitoxin system